MYQSGFDPAWAEQSAGTVLLNDTVRSAIGEQVDEVDFLMGGEPYKWRFAPEPRVVRTIVLVGATSPARALVTGEAFAREHGKRLASRPRAGAPDESDRADASERPLGLTGAWKRRP